ncbi:hypothetical protein ALO43_200586 [Pseudomonas tremae]|uniref:Sensory box-containing diguanylate cye n=1 Tax=Pseudomonas tremae TaxID=200454 RepID=A0AA40TTK0_9PSED|nr:hypothetical protein ALO43_200586 [Pseudomonas tremae]
MAFRRGVFLRYDLALRFFDLLLRRLISPQIGGNGSKHLLGVISELLGIQRLAERGHGAREVGPLQYNRLDVLKDEAR